MSKKKLKPNACWTTCVHYFTVPVIKELGEADHAQLVITSTLIAHLLHVLILYDSNNIIIMAVLFCSILIRRESYVCTNVICVNISITSAEVDREVVGQAGGALLGTSL